MTQEFHLSVTPVGAQTYLIRTERVESGVPLAEEQVVWPVDRWIGQARQLLNDPVSELLQGGAIANGSQSLWDLASLPDAADSVSTASLVALGREIYSALFQGTIRDSWMAAQSIAQNRRDVLRLRLGLQGTQLQQVPWEVLHNGDCPLATGVELSFSRYQPERGVSSFKADRWILQPHQPLRILMAIAAPSDQERLALAQEFRHLQAELQQGLAQTPLNGRAIAPEIQVTLLEQPGRAQLTQALEQGHYQIFHYAGHSDLGTAGGSLYLVNPKTGLTETLSGEDLAGLLVNNGIYMAVLNSCRSAYTPAADAPAETGSQNLAQALIRRGVPGVLAMAERIPDEVALTLSRLLYRNLKQGYPIDLSLSRTRQGLISAYGSHQLYWALPILYLHAEFGGQLTAGDRPSAQSLPSSVYPSLMDHSLDDLLANRSLIQEGLLHSPAYSPGQTSHHASHPAEPESQAWGHAPAASDLASMHSNDSLASDQWDSASQDPLAADADWLDATGQDDFLSELENWDEEDANEVAYLVQRLTQTADPLEPIMPAAPDEDLLPESTLHFPTELYSDWLEPPREASDSAPTVPATDSSLFSSSKTTLLASVDAAPVAASQTAEAKTASSSAVQAAPAAIAAPRSSQLWMRQLGLGLGLLGVIAATGLGIWAWQSEGFGRPSPSSLLANAPDLPPAPPLNLAANQSDLSQLDTAAVTTIAIAALQNQNLDQAQSAIEALLNRGALPQAKAVLAQVPHELLDDPPVNFLKGRLAWQLIQSGDPDYAIEDARRFWDAAVREDDQIPAYLTALGFAYYAEDKPTEAIQVWIRALRLLQQTTDGSAAGIETQETFVVPALANNSEALNIYAGLALASTQAAADQPDFNRNNLRNEARKFYQAVQTQAPEAFQPQALAQNWFWTEAAIADWQTLPTQLN